MEKIKICIIGAGPAGLVAVKYSKECPDVECVCYERQGKIGGMWNFQDAVGYDEFHMPIHSSLFAAMRTNIPLSVMQFNDYCHPEENMGSFLSHTKVMEYLEGYAEHFKLMPHVKLRHNVKLVTKQGDMWKVTVEDLVNKKELINEFDSVIICNGHYQVPFVPSIKDIDEFLANGGVDIHTTYFRDSALFENQRVLIIGYGSSCKDVVCEIYCCAKSICISRLTYDDDAINPFEDKVEIRPSIDKINKRTVTFKDGTSQEFDIIMYGTGYLYRYPFLDETSKLKNYRNRYVFPLYKRMVNIFEPSMALIGVPIGVILFPLMDLQVRVFLSLLRGHVKVPSKTEMFKSWLSDINALKAKGLLIRNYNVVTEDDDVNAIYDDIASAGNVAKVPPVYEKIQKEINHYFKYDYKNLRKAVYNIIDDENYISIKLR